MTKNLEDAKNEIDAHKKHQEEMSKKFDEVSKKAAEGAAAIENSSSTNSHESTLAAFRQNRGHN